MKYTSSSIAVLLILTAVDLLYGQQQAGVPKRITVGDFPNLQAQAKEYGEVFVRKDLERLADLTYPKYIEIVGGKQNLIAIGARTITQMEADNLRVLSWEPSEATQLLDESGVLYGVVPMTMRVKAANQTVEWYDCLIASSIDRGQHWTFVSSTCVKLAEAFPAVASKLILCAAKPDHKVTEPTK